MKSLRLSMLVVIFFQAFVFSANASLTGVWTGEGTGKDSKGWQGRCPNITYQFDVKPEALHVLEALVDCTAFSIEYDPIALRIEDNKLYYEDLQVGTIHPNIIVIIFKDRDVELQYHFVRDGDKIKYFQREVFGEDLLEIAGTLHRTLYRQTQ